MRLLLLELAQNFFLGSTLRQTSSGIGESEPSVQAGLQSMVPLVGGGLLVQAQRPGGAAEVARLAQQLYRRGLLTDLSELLVGLQRSPAADSSVAADMLHTLLGSTHSAILASISQQAGLRLESARRLLSIVVAVLLGLLGRLADEQDLDAAKLANYLESQRDAIRQAVSNLPGDVGSSLLDLLSSSSRTTAKIVANASDPAEHPTVVPMPEAPLPAESLAASPILMHPISSPAPHVESRACRDQNRGQNTAGSSPQTLSGAGGTTTNQSPTSGEQVASHSAAHPPVRPTPPVNRPLKRWLWLLALLGVALLAYVGVRSRMLHRQLPPTPSKVAAPARVAPQGIPAAATGYYEVVTDKYYYDPGPAVQLHLPTGRTLQVGAHSAEAQLFYTLTDDTQARPDKAQAGICLDRVSFTAGTATLTTYSQQQLTNLGTLLQAYPTARLKVGGFTDNKGRAEANLLLSADRANAVRKALLGQAIAPSRVAAQGYGPTHPLVSNATHAGRAQNRRVAILLLNK
jgi:OOP family OmpA-OmpF porin